MITQKYLEEMAARLAERLAEDIEQSKTREEHIRTTARANEAAELLVVIKSSAVDQQKVKTDDKRFNGLLLVRRDLRV